MNREVVCTVAMDQMYITEEDYSYMMDVQGLSFLDGHVYICLLYTSRCV